MQFLIHNITELVALIIAIAYYPHLKKTFMKWVLPFLLFIFSCELISTYMILFYPGKSTFVIYYFIGVVEVFFYGYIFYKIINRALYRSVIKYLVVISVSVYIIGFILDNENYIFYIPSLILSSFSIAIFGLGYIYTKFIDDNNTILINEPGFWIAFGVSLFFAGSSIVFSLYDFIVKNNLNIFGIKLYNFIPRILCVVLYSSISIAIILCKKKTRVSL